MEDSKFLTNEECLKLEILQKQQMIKKLEKFLLEKDQAILKHQQEEFKLKIALLDAERYKLSEKITRKNDQLNQEMSEAKKFHLQLEEKYELKSGWGFDPDSLKIIEKED